MATAEAPPKDLDAIATRHLDWSAKQGRILSAGGKAESLYTAERGFPFDESELPHFHLLQSTDATRRVFEEWKTNHKTISPIVGAWKRPVFCGGWENSTDHDERVFNVQTNTLFIDLRIPTTKNLLLQDTNAKSLSDLNGLQLCYYARQHCFAGYSFPSVVKTADDTAAVLFDACFARHHCIDWNFCGVSRSRPNKWWVDMEPVNRNSWKELAFATNQTGQQYYWERWDRLEGDATTAATGPVVALRKADGRDGVIVIVGNHFNYCLARQGVPDKAPGGMGSMVGVVDAAVETGDLDTARAWLSEQGGHGTLSTGWMIDAALEFWKEGTPLWSQSEVSVQGTSMDDCIVEWKGERWDVFECNLESPQDLQALLWKGL